MYIPKTLFAVLTFFVLFFIDVKSSVAADYTAFSHIPVQHEGRIKPLDSFARNYLLMFYGKERLENMSAVSWMAEVLLDPTLAYRREIFNVANPAVVNALGLKWDTKHKYTFVDIYKGVMSNKELYQKLAERDAKSYTSIESQLMDIQGKAFSFYDLTRSFSLILPNFSVQDKKIADALAMDIKTPYTYLDMLQRKSEFETLLEQTPMLDGKATTAYERELLALGSMMQRIGRDGESQLLSVIPPAVGDAWVSPWQVFVQGEGSPISASLLELWKGVLNAYQMHDVDAFERLSESLREHTMNATDDMIDENRIYLERLYNALSLNTKSLAFYIFGLILFVASLFVCHKKLLKIALLCLFVAFFCLLISLCLRMFIMARPPVTTLYESIIFVSFIATVFGLILEKKRKDGLGIFIACVLGVVLQFIGLRYASEGDTMGMLVAVLDTNFWLATHVVTISIGYGCALVSGAIGHVYLVKRMTGKTNELNDIMRMMLGVSLVALFFCILGTILGGIWADQSWGRFWGWDPKENGAMLICLWLIWVVHGRLANLLKNEYFAAAIVVTNIIVALAWFGVNLLNVGLHSYGFTTNIATNLALFCGFELAFIIVSLAIINLMKRP